MSQDNTFVWNVIEKYFDNNYVLVKHHLDSYDDFYGRDIFKILNEKNPIKIHKNYNDSIDDFEFKCNMFIGGKDGKKVYFGKPIINDKDHSHYMYPNEARLRNMTYATTIHYDVLVEFTLINENNERISKTITLEKILLGRFPIMLHSNLCVLNNMTKELKYSIGECKHDNGGYFIINGKEKVIVPQEKFADNMLYIKENTDSNIYSHSAVVRCAAEDSSKPVRTMKVHVVRPSTIYSNNQIVVEIPNVRKPIPFFIVMRALGIISDKSIIQHTVFDIEENSEYLQHFIPSIHDASTIFTQETAIKYISTFTKHMTISQVMDILSNYLLPQVGEMNFEQKAFYLGNMVFKLLNVYLKIDKPTDRDNFKFKRVETSGKLIYDLFKEYYEIQQKKIQSKIDKEIYYHINTKTLKETDLVNIINDNYLEFFKERIVEDGFQKAFKGNWGAQAHTKKVGAVQDLNRLSYNSFISHLRKINLPLDSSAKVVGPRLLHGSQYGLIDPVDTPDGGSIGIHKSMSVVATITTEYSRDLLVDWLRKNIKMMYLDECRIESINDYIKIFINGTLIGLVKDLYENIDFLKLNRRMGVLPIYTSISYSSKNKSIDLFTDAGRMCRPIYYLDEHNKLPILNGEIQKKIERKEITWKDLTYGFNIDDKNEYFKEENEEKKRSTSNKAIIDYVDSNEVESLLISNSIEAMSKNKYYTNVEIHPSLMFGVMGNQIIFAEQNPYPRDLFSCGQSKQAVSCYHSNYQSRMDKTGIVLNYGQKPLIKTRYTQYLNNEELPYGENTIVAIMSYGGYNVEDAILVNKGAVDRGLFRTTYYSTYEAHEESSSVSGSEVETKFLNIDKYNVLRKKLGADYSHLDKDGLIKEGTIMDDSKVVIGKATQLDFNEYADSSVGTKKGQLGIVDKSYMTQGEEGFRLAKVRLREERVPAIGDKMASRAGQKGTIGLIIPEEDMPFTADGIKPDLIINPHAVPSRMTIGQLVECIIGKACCNLGSFGDCTSFISEKGSLDLFGKILGKQGFNNYGDDILYNGMTGEQLNTTIFMGPTYYMRLKHMVKDKINYRSKGPNTMLTRQAVQGRANDGGLRIGEMERDGIIAHGASKFLNESMLERGDLYYMAVCNKSGTIAIYNENQDIFFSPAVDGPVQYTGVLENNIRIKNISRHGRSFSIVKIPYSLKLLIQELQTMNIQTRIITEDNIEKFESLSFSDNYKKLTFDNITSLSEHYFNIRNKIGLDKIKKRQTNLENEKMLINSDIAYDDIDSANSNDTVPWAPELSDDYEYKQQTPDSNSPLYSDNNSPVWRPNTTSSENNPRSPLDTPPSDYEPRSPSDTPPGNFDHRTPSDTPPESDESPKIRLEENIEDAQDEKSILQPEKIEQEEQKNDEKEKKEILKEFGKEDEDENENGNGNGNGNGNEMNESITEDDSNKKKIIIGSTEDEGEPAVGNGKKIKLNL